MDKFVFKIDNKIEDYFAIYPVVNKSVWSSNRWIKLLFGLFLLLVVISIFLSVKSPVVAKEYGYAWTATTVVFIVFIGKILETKVIKNRAVAYVNHLISKGVAEITIDLVGVEMKFAKEINLSEWINVQLQQENDYMMLTDHSGNLISIIPQGSITDKGWLEIQENITAIIKSSAIKRHGLE